MIGRAMRRLRRGVGGDGRWVRPDRSSVAVLAVVAALAAAGAGWAWVWATRSASPARTLALAASVHRGPLALDSALEVTWAWSVGGTAELEDRWLKLVAPALPPGLCLPAGGERGVRSGDPAPEPSGSPAARSGRGALDRALRRLDEAVRRGGSRDELERRIGEVRAAADVGGGSREAFLTRYGLARGYAAAGDWATAADVLEPVFRGRLAPERVPETRLSHARSLVASGRVTRALAVDALHGRVLAGAIAYHRGEPELAVAYFRRAINGVYYLLAPTGAGGLTPDGHFQRVAADPADAACAASQEVLTSLDAYAGLVASYMADHDFRDPGGLPREVARSRLQIDPDDPVGPVLQHARRTGGDPERTPIPENLLWAASNLQRVYHHNRIRPDPRLEVTRAVLLLHLTRDPTWAAALRRAGGADPCGMLATLGEDLHREGAAGRPLAVRDPTSVDSARAAVAVQTFARLDRECEATGTPEVEPATRSAWIRLGGGYLTRGLGSRYETVRADLASILAAGQAPAPVLEERFAPGLGRVQTDLHALERGRIPPELPADLPVDPVLRYASEWWEAVFTDVAAALARTAREPAPGGTLRAGEVDVYLTALESAVDHAGLRPADVYPGTGTASLARAAHGRTGALLWRARTSVRNHPGWWAAALVGAFSAVALVALLVHVSWWRYRLLTRQRFYVDEHRAGEGRVVA